MTPKNDGLTPTIALALVALGCGLQSLLFQCWTVPEANAAQVFQAPACQLRLENIEVVDGDTIHADICFPYGVCLTHQTIRASDYDAWESRRTRRAVGTITDAEIEKGKIAKADLEALKADGFFLVPEGKGTRDNYGRILGRLFSKGQTIANYMHTHNHCRPQRLVELD